MPDAAQPVEKDPACELSLLELHVDSDSVASDEIFSI